MNSEAIRALIKAERFFPFRIFHKRGITYDVSNPDFAWVSPFGLYVVTEDNNGNRKLNILNTDLIERIETHEEAGEP